MTGDTPTAIFTLGLPAAGKSTVISAAYANTHTVLDCDSIKESHPAYDPANPAALHAWSKGVLAERFAEALRIKAPFVYDSTGTDVARMSAGMAAAREAGFKVVLEMVSVPLHVSIERNLTRSRRVPLPIIITKAGQVRDAFATLAPNACEARERDNSRYDPAFA